MRLIESIAQHWRQGGPKLILRRAGRRVLGVVYRSMDLTLQANAALGEVEVPEIEGVTLREVDLDDLLEAGFSKAHTYPERFERRFRSGEVALAGFVDGEIAHVGWLAPNRLMIDRGIEPVHVEDAAGVYDMFTLPEFRGRGIHTASLATLCRIARERGFDRAVATVHKRNAPSLHVAEKLGFRTIGKVRYRRYLWIERVRTTGLD